MVDKLVAVDSGLHLPPAVRDQLAEDFDADMSAYSASASASAATATAASGTAVSSAAAAAASAALAAAPTDAMVASLVANIASDSRIAMDITYGGMVNVLEYGATGNGTTDDTTACQNALDAGAGGQVFFPAGVYSVNPLYVSDKTRVYGAGSSTVIFRRAATVTNPDSVGALNVHGTSGTHLTNVSIESMTIDGNKANIIVNTGAGGDPFDVEALSFKYTDFFRVTAVRTINATAEGIDVDDSTDGVITDCWGIDCGGSAVHLSNGSNRVRVASSYAITCGAAISRGGFDAYSGGANHSFVGCITVSCYRGITLGGPGSVAVGCLDFTPTMQGFRGTGVNTTFSGCRTTGDITHTAVSGTIVGCTAGGTITTTDPAVSIIACSPDTPAEATLTYATNWSAGSTVRVVRRGQWATATYRFDKAVSAATEQETMVTLPVGFRPVEATYAGGMVFNGSSAYVAGGVQVQTGGQMQVRLCGATGVTRVVGQATWRVA